MDIGEEVASIVENLLNSCVSEWTQPEINRLDGVLAAEKLIEAVGTLKAHNWGYLAAVTGLDNGAEAGTLTVIYHFCAGSVVLSLRVELPRDLPVIPSIAALCPAAIPFERETGEMLGITFSGAPDTSFLFLPDDWPEGVYPLRKDEVVHVQQE